MTTGYEWEGTAEKQDRGVVKTAGVWSGLQGVGQDCRGMVRNEGGVGQDWFRGRYEGLCSW